MRILHQPTFVLHHRPYRETSLIVDLLTKEHGRVATVARGVRIARSTTRALLQPFTPLLISWQGRGELTTLTAVEMHGLPIRLQGNFLLSGFYLNEVIMRVLHKHDSQVHLYTIYHETLLKLQSAQSQQKTLRIFEKKLLKELGYGLQLQYDITHVNPIVEERFYRFIPEQGFEWYQNAGDAVIANLFSGKSLLALENEELEEEEVLRDAKRLMRLALAPLLGKNVLHSRKLFLEVQK